MDGSEERAGYRRSAGSARGEARRLELLEKVSDELGVNGLVDFSLRRAARAAGTTHKVLLYYFDGPEDLLTQAVLRLRTRRIDRSMAAAAAADLTLAGRVRAMWPVLIGDEASGAGSGDRSGDVRLGSVCAVGAREASKQYLPFLLSICPADWDPQRKHEVAELILGVLRGFLVEWRTSGDAARNKRPASPRSTRLDR